MRALLSFFTVFPARGASLEAAARNAYLLPLVGLFTGAAGAVLIPLSYALPPGVVATLALGAIVLAAGLHHTDGVLDVGDALMVRGEPEQRLTVLKDARVGVGGLGALFVVYAPALAALTALVAASPPARRSPCSPLRSRPALRCCSCSRSASPPSRAPPRCPSCGP